MTDEELQHIKRNGIMLKDAVYVVDKLITDVQQARKERDWLAEHMPNRRCPNGKTSYTCNDWCHTAGGNVCYSCLLCWLKAAKEAISQDDSDLELLKEAKKSIKNGFLSDKESTEWFNKSLDRLKSSDDSISSE